MERKNETSENPFAVKDKMDKEKLESILAANGLADAPQEIRDKVFAACNDVLKWKDEQVQGFLFAETIYTAPRGMLEGLTTLNDELRWRWLNYQIGKVKDYNDCDKRIEAVRRANAMIY